MNTSDSVLLHSLYAYLLRCNPDSIIKLGDRGYCDGVGSWRGAYEELTVHPSIGPGYNARTLAEKLKEYIDGREYHGYKGGDYTAHRLTRVFADGLAEYTEHAIVGAHEAEGVVHLHIWEPTPDTFTQWTVEADDIIAKEIAESFNLGVKAVYNELTLKAKQVKP